MFASGDLFMLPDDPLGRGGPHLRDFLHKHNSTNIHAKSCCLSSRDQGFGILWFRLFFIMICTTFQSLGSCDIFIYTVYIYMYMCFIKSLLLTKAVFIGYRYNKTVKYFFTIKNSCFLCEYVLN